MEQAKLDKILENHKLWLKTKGDKGDKGDAGANGKDGYTPVRGKDYLTYTDKQEMVNAVISALPKYNGEVAAE